MILILPLFSELGLLNITHKQAEHSHLNTQYNLSDRRFIQLFLATTGQSYRTGHTEKAMVRFLVRLHFGVANEQIRWLHE